jgi:integrase
MGRPLLFKSQAKWFLENSVTRRRNPIKPATAYGWENCFRKWLEPRLGDSPLASVNNSSLKQLVAELCDAGLSAQSIVTYVGLVKLIVASALDENGEELFPRKWNHDFIDLPVIEKQHRPTFTSDTVSSIVRNSTGMSKVLFAILAGSGLRIGEAFGLEVKHVTPDCKTLTIEQAVWEDRVQTPKTRNAYRQVDLCPELAEMLRTFIGKRTDGFVFGSRNGSPLLQSNIRNRKLYPLLDSLKVPRSGFHSFRRYRLTWLRRQKVPEGLIRYWMGHGNLSVTDGYEVFEDVIYRQNCSEQAGIGFSVPSVVS